MPAEELKLIERSRGGDTAAFGELIALYEKKVYNLAYRFTNNAEDSLDLAQEAFLRAFTNLKDFRGTSSFGTWIHRITTNLCLDEIRRRRRQPVYSLDVAVTTEEGGEVERQLVDESDTPLETVEKRELHEAIQAGINSLDDEFRLAVILRDVQGHSYEEIAEIMGVNIGTVKSRISRGRRALKEKLTFREQNEAKFVKVLGTKALGTEGG